MLIKLLFQVCKYKFLLLQLYFLKICINLVGKGQFKKALDTVSYYLTQLLFPYRKSQYMIISFASVAILSCVTSVLCFFERQFLTMYPPQAVRQIILAVDRFVAGGDVAEVAGLLHAVWWGKRLQGKQAMIAVHLRWYICQRQKQFQKENDNMLVHKHMQTDPTTLSYLEGHRPYDQSVLTNANSTLNYEP